jgi:hypothetical protein
MPPALIVLWLSREGQVLPNCCAGGQRGPLCPAITRSTGCSTAAQGDPVQTVYRVYISALALAAQGCLMLTAEMSLSLPTSRCRFWQLLGEESNVGEIFARKVSTWKQLLKDHHDRQAAAILGPRHHPEAARAPKSQINDSASWPSVAGRLLGLLHHGSPHRAATAWVMYIGEGGWGVGKLTSFSSIITLLSLHESCHHRYCVQSHEP